MQTDTPAAITETSITNIAVDPEPMSLRLTLVGLLFASLVVSYIVFNVLFPGVGLNLIAIIASVVAAAVSVQLFEKLLKPVWRKTRFVQVTPDAIRLVSKNRVQYQINPQLQVNVLMWHFPIQRRTRVPKGWHLVACALEQDEIYIPVYTLVSPQEFEEINKSGRFTQLQNIKKEFGRDERDMRLAGQQRRLHIGESARVFDGAEMIKSDFEFYLSRLETLFPRWMSVN